MLSVIIRASKTSTANGFGCCSLVYQKLDKQAVKLEAAYIIACKSCLEPVFLCGLFNNKVILAKIRQNMRKRCEKFNVIFQNKWQNIWKVFFTYSHKNTGSSHVCPRCSGGKPKAAERKTAPDDLCSAIIMQLYS